MADLLDYGGYFCAGHLNALALDSVKASAV
jgi:hypothetical protein